MDEPSFYGFPCYGEPTVKAAQDCGGPGRRPGDPGDDVGRGDARPARPATWRGCCPGSGPPVRSLRCQYTLTPDRDFVVDRVPGHPDVVVGLGAAHGFKFAPTFGRLLADLATGRAGRRTRRRSPWTGRRSPIRRTRRTGWCEVTGVNDLGHRWFLHFSAVATPWRCRNNRLAGYPDGQNHPAELAP